MHKREKQHGQALPLGLAFIMFGSLLGIVLFNTGQLASEKTRLANTADAAAYSGLIWQARALNFQAYTNRAMVANQVSIAQVVSLASWTAYGKITARNINNTIGWVPVLKPYTQGLENAMRTVDNIMQGVAEVAIPVFNAVTGVLSSVQSAMYGATFIATPEVVNAVVKRNDQRYEALNTAYSIASLGNNASAWRNLTTQYTNGDQIQRKADVITDSRDAFTRNRGWDTGRIYLGPVLRVELVKEGETRLLKDTSNTGNGSANGFGVGNSSEEWSWKGKDTMSFHVDTFRCSWRGCGWKRNEIPIGWGEAYVGPDIDDCNNNLDSGFFSFFRSGCNWGDRNRRAERLADREKTAIDTNYDGVRAYYDLRNLSRDNKDPRLALSVEVQVNDGEVRTSSKIDGVGSDSAPGKLRNGIGEGMFRADDKFASTSMASISSAEVYFKRPAAHKLMINDANGNPRARQEYASLFNPYWQVRLKETAHEQRLFAWGIRAPGFLSGGNTGSLN